MITTIADAVVSELNSGSFSQDFTAVRKALPAFTLSDMSALHVTVVPRAIENEIVSRAQDSHEVQIDVAVQKKLPGVDNTDVDPLMTLVQEIADHLERKMMDSAYWRNTKNEPIYSPKHLREMRQFTSVLTLTYRVLAR